MAHAPAAEPRRRRPELKALTGLRAVAATAVVVSHLGVPHSLPNEFAEVARMGFIGVPLFFMLSGVVLGYNYPDLTFRPGRRAAMFYVARIARVMPLYWAMVVYCALFYVANDERQYPSALVQNLLAVQAWSPDVQVAQEHYNGPGWSIGVELFFYALFPLLVPVVAAIYRRYGLVGASMVVALCCVVLLALAVAFTLSGRADLPATDPDSAHRWLYRNPLCLLPLFVCGLAVAFLLPHVRAWSQWGHQLVQFGVPLYVLGVAVFRGSGGFWTAASYSALFILPFAVLLLSLSTGRGWVARFLGTRPMVALGVASFALYLTHRWLIWQLNTYPAIAEGRNVEPYVAFALTLGVLLLVAEGAHRYIEEPARRAITSWSRAALVAVPRTEPRSEAPHRPTGERKIVGAGATPGR
jgi:peptidoglycan/LPS O-acetylase OafA/YrhL